ncbi:phage terminase large subunit [Marivibrio halodurans]|uniref:Phage terminase large subunit n=1 Tax=Marivibrio halodurans TaxID=2039722 RepID=A0A8J7V1B3_9PROT|nr:phage terminase large subunit [Marivibrio halodurans]MBP5855672.1 phage terminase large subunit [Marivibrio halodurans]
MLPKEVAEDFRNFLYLVWMHLGLPAPTPAQYEIAYFMQHGFPEGYKARTGRAEMVRAFRGIGKSYIAAAYCLWLLGRDPKNEKILVVSASSPKAKEFVSQVKNILGTMDILKFLRPQEGQRNSFDRFDVRGASISQSPSLKAAGITGQITGSRATRIIADDIEVPENSRTEDSRETLLRNVNEFDAIKVPAEEDAEGHLTRPAGDVLFLGTPQTEESIYNRLVTERGFNCFTVPARFPRPEKMENYLLMRDSGEKVNILAPFVQDAMDKGAASGDPVDPKRFSDEDLISREAKGRSWFALQYMLDTSLSDAERYPLKQFDFVVYPLNADKAPLTIQWGTDTGTDNVYHDIPNVGFSGDKFLGPLFVDRTEYRPYEGSIMFVDPSGRGKDETAWVTLKHLNGMLFCPHLSGWNGGVDEAMLKIAKDVLRLKVNKVLVEPNYGGEIWINAFKPVMSKAKKQAKMDDWPVAIEEAEWASGQKEQRIIDTVEPVLNAHRVVIDDSVARDETFIYQLTHLSRERGSLNHDDRIDAFAGAVASYEKAMAMDTDEARRDMEREELDEMLEDFIDSCQTPGFTRKARRKGTSVVTYDTLERKITTYEEKYVD